MKSSFSKFLLLKILSGHLQPFILSGAVPPSASVVLLLWGLLTLYTTLATPSSNISMPTKAKTTAAVEFTVDVLGKELFFTPWAADWGTGWVPKSPVTSKREKQMDKKRHALCNICAKVLYELVGGLQLIHFNNFIKLSHFSWTLTHLLD